MARPYSEDIRQRALARADAGETDRSIAAALQISPSCVTEWKNLRRETGGVSPGKFGGHKKPVLSAPMLTGCASAFARGIDFAEADQGAGCARNQDRYAADPRDLKATWRRVGKLLDLSSRRSAPTIKQTQDMFPYKHITL